MKRIVLFLATNLAIVVVLTAVAQVLGLDAWLTAHGGGMGGLVAFALLFGFGGALLSLALSKWTAKRAMGVRVIDAPRNEAESWLLATVRRQAAAVGIAMPEVGIFDAPQPNAFATGANRDKALVAVSTGLLRDMERSEVEAVLAHEVSHVANGDMVTLALIQGVVNTFVIVLARVVGSAIDRILFRNEEGYGPGYFVSVIVAEIVFGVLASAIVMWFSRRREYRADAGGAQLAGTSAMIAALERLRSAHEPLPAQFTAFGIAGGEPVGWRRWFMSHPSLDQRIAALRAARAR